MSNVLSNLPIHNLYVELLSGENTNLKRKTPTKSEVYNDTRDLILDFFKVIRYKELNELFIKYVFEYDTDNEVYKNTELNRGITPERWEELSNFYFDFNNNKIEGNIKRCSGYRPMTKETEKYVRNISDNLVYMVTRLRMLQYEKRPYTDIIERFDSKETLFYVDVTRAKKDSINEKELAFNLLKVKGKCIVFGVQDSNGYSILIDEGWREHYDEENNLKLWLNFKV